VESRKRIWEQLILANLWLVCQRSVFVAMEDTENLSTQEREILTYLEDLQQNNPAEYELLVQQMQEQRAAKEGGGGGSGGGGQQGEQVMPLPGFVAKTVSATRKGCKVFINVCQSEHVDKPAPVEGKSNAEEVQMRIPLSLGPPREDLDKDAAVCTVYDCVFHPDAVENALKEPEFRAFVMQLILHQIQDKYKDELSQVYWDPCLIPPHRVRPILHTLNPVCA
jgi:hypothetical protein